MKDFKDAIIQIQNGWYIDAIRFLSYLEARVSLLTERIAVPGTDYPTTEALRGRYVELVSLLQQITEHTNVKRTNERA